MPQIVTAIHVDATPSRVFEVLTDTARYGEWNGLMRLIAGKFKKDGLILAKIILPGAPVVFDAKVVRYEPGRAIAWKGPSLSLLHPIAMGEHYFEIEDLGNGKSRVVHGERFDGVIPQMASVWNALESRLRPAYEGFNQELKKRVEARA